jgi:hypothetical protein
MPKPKIDPKEFLLKNGEKLAMGLSGGVLALLLIWGATKYTSAKPPDETAKYLKQQTQNVYTAIQNGEASPDDVAKLGLPEWIRTKPSFATPRVPEFTQTGTLFDPTAQPNTKRENPTVLTIGAYQVDLTRSAMLGFDIVPQENGESLIAVFVEKRDGKYDKDKIGGASKLLQDQSLKGKAALQKLNSQKKTPAQPAPMGPMPPAPMGPTPPRGGSSEGGEGNPFGGGPGGFDQGAQRIEKAIRYIPISDLDKSVAEGKPPAFTVIPLRLVTIHAVVPYKKQLEEMKRALRLQTEAEARQWGPWYDGYEVQRKVSQVMPDGSLRVLQNWPADIKDTSANYLFEEKYIELIDSRKIADHFDEGYIPYFLKPEMMLAMPLPRLAEGLGVKYPEVKLKDITDNIDKLKKANQKEIPPSELLNRVKGTNPKNKLYAPKAADVGGFGYESGKYGPTATGMGSESGMSPMPPAPAGKGPAAPGPGGPRPAPPEGFGPGSGATETAAEVENFLLRFVDCDVKPGHVYEYRIRLRMWNPNYKQDQYVANPEFAKDSYKTLYSKWLQLETPITVPAESFLYAHDVKAYRDAIDAQYPRDSKEVETRAVNSLLQAKDGQAVLQVATWMEQVRTDAAKREPVGGWVVSEMPVGRGEYVGRKQFVKLPLWSSELQQYVLREVAEKVAFDRFGKPTAVQPKGWLVDFSTKSVLVDFEGGRVKSRTRVSFDGKGQAVTNTNDRNLDEDVATEVLIVRADGKLVVRNSQTDDTDPNRSGIVKGWAEWLKDVEKRVLPKAGMSDNPFDKKGP